MLKSPVTTVTVSKSEVDIHPWKSYINRYKCARSFHVCVAKYWRNVTTAFKFFANIRMLSRAGTYRCARGLTRRSWLKSTWSTASSAAASFCMPVSVRVSDRKLTENWFFGVPAVSPLDYFVVTAQLNGQRIPLFVAICIVHRMPNRRLPCFCSIVEHAS